MASVCKNVDKMNSKIPALKFADFILSDKFLTSSSELKYDNYSHNPIKYEAVYTFISIDI